MAARRYTAQEMREASLWFHYPPNSTGKARRFDGIEISAMLRQAADSLDAMERVENELLEKSRIVAELNEVRELNRRCCDENDRLRAAADLQDGVVHLPWASPKREKRRKYEYAEMYSNGDVGHEKGDSIDDVNRFLGDGSIIVRREVGEWEEVPVS